MISAAVAISMATAASAQAFADITNYTYDEYWGVYFAYDDDTGKTYYYDESGDELYDYYVDDDGNMNYYNDTTDGTIIITDVIVGIPEEPEIIVDKDYVQHHTQEEIKAKYIELGLNKKWSTEYAEEPSIKSPYSAGKLTDKSLDQALNMLNFIRYTAGLPEVEMDDAYNYSAQCASLVNAANNLLTHYPKQPSGMSDELYEVGQDGACSSNLGYGHNSITASLVSYMSDSDPLNIDCVGHRRWLIYPLLKKVGFGYAGRYTATHVVGGSESRNSFNGDYVAWPPENMPMELYQGHSDRYAFSINVGKYYNKRFLNDAVVKVTLKNTGESWTISRSNNDDTYFRVDNSYRGLDGCIIFDTGTRFKSGDKVSVNISNIKDYKGRSTEINYDVNFFTMFPTIKDCEISPVKTQTYTGKALTPKPVIKFEGKTLKEGVDYTLKYRYNKQIGKGEIVVKGKGKYSGKTSVYFNIKPCKEKITSLTKGKKAFTVKWKALTGVEYYEIQYSTSSSMKNAKTEKVLYYQPNSLTIQGLKSGKKYYVRVRACSYDYLNLFSGNYLEDKFLNGAWSAIKTVKVE